jgi:hypothetical protein
MTTVSPGRSTPNRRRAHAALGTAAAAMVGVAAVVVGAQFIGVTPPASAGPDPSTTGSTRPAPDTSPYCPGAYQCLQPGADPLVPYGPNPLVPYGPAMWNSGAPSGPVSGSYTRGAV